MSALTLGAVEVSADGQSAQVCGKAVIYTLRVGETYHPQSNSDGVKRSDCVVRGFTQATPGLTLVVVDYPNGAKRRRTVAVNVKNITGNYIVPSVPRELARDRRRASTATLNTDLLAQAIADIAELRARVSRLEGSK